jgi:hypothetical protein
MKTISIFLVILFVALQSFGQNPSLSKEDYLQKSKNQKKTGWILLGGGTAIAVAGTISMSNQDFWSSDNSGYDTAGYLMLGGLAVGLASIPFFISSAKNANKAATISFNYQKTYFSKHDIFVAKMQPAITIKIPL